MRTNKDKYKVFQMYVPFDLDFDQVVSMFKFNGIKVDDLCDVCRDGRAINIWIKVEDLDDYTIDQKVGSFL